MDAPFTPTNLLDYLLEGAPLSPDDLDQFIKENPDEGQYFEYKDGKIASRQERQKGSQTIREYVSGFANSDGGVLIIGVSEDRPRTISPCELHIGSQPLAEWASRCLQDMAGYFSPQPRFQVIDHPPEGPILTIAVARAPSLVPCVESRAMKYFFRICDSTLQIPEYLIADLVLGRRHRALLDLHSPQLARHPRSFPPSEGSEHTIDAWGASFSCVVENLSLTAAEDVQVGVISWSLMERQNPGINTHLRAYLEVLEPQGPQHPILHLNHFSTRLNGEKIELSPFQSRSIGLSQRLPQYINIPRGFPTEILAAVYVMAKDVPPTWFQLAFESQVGGFPLRPNVKDFQPSLIRIERERPQVAWRQQPYTRYVPT